MAANHSTLNACLEVADSMESALNCLGDTSQWPADQDLRQRCADYRQTCRELAEQKGLNEFAIAFIGPKNAGKTSLLSMLVRNPALREQLASGDGVAGSTEKILWLSAQPIAELDRRFEESLQADARDLANLGCTYTLIDVPGANEAHRERAAAAQRALRAAHLKVLIVEARTMEDASLLDYIHQADGATVLPVINQVRPGIEEEDIQAFLLSLQASVTGSHILPAMRLPDFHLDGENEADVRREATRELIERLQSVIRTDHLDELLEPQLKRLSDRFRSEMHSALTKALPATAEAASELKELESGLAVQALDRLLGASDKDRAVLAGLRQQLRALYQQRTPVLLFPWRTFVGLANLLHGALEKVPLLLAGSLPSLVSSAMTAVKNVTRDREFTEDRHAGLRKHAELLVKESLYPRVDRLEAALRSDLRTGPGQSSEHRDLEIEFEGLEMLQSRSSRLFQNVLEARGPGRGATIVTGLVGLALFWSIFIWPFISLYRDYFHAIQVFVSEDANRTIFPTDSFSMIGTSFLLALFPMLLWLLLVLSWVASRGRALDCLHQLRAGHQSIIEELNAKHLLRVRARHPHLQACLRLFSRESL